MLGMPWPLPAIPSFFFFRWHRFRREREFGLGLEGVPCLRLGRGGGGGSFRAVAVRAVSSRASALWLVVIIISFGSNWGLHTTVNAWPD